MEVPPRGARWGIAFWACLILVSIRRCRTGTSLRSMCPASGMLVATPAPPVATAAPPYVRFFWSPELAMGRAPSSVAVDGEPGPTALLDVGPVLGVLDLEPHPP